jgi:hypothetical protein
MGIGFMVIKKINLPNVVKKSSSSRGGSLTCNRLHSMWGSRLVRRCQAIMILEKIANLSKNLFVPARP